jgi:hypothetical protein
MPGVLEAALQFIVRLQFLIVTVQFGDTAFISDFTVCAARREHAINPFKLVRKIQRVENIAFLVWFIYETLCLLC